MTEVGDTTRQSTKPIWGNELRGKAAQAILAAVLFSLVTGLWVCLWVPARPIF